MIFEASVHSVRHDIAFFTFSSGYLKVHGGPINRRCACMDYPHRHPERVTTSYPIAIRFSVSGGCLRHRCRATMCCPSPGDDVGNPYTHTADLSAFTD